MTDTTTSQPLSDLTPGKLVQLRNETLERATQHAKAEKAERAAAAEIEHELQERMFKLGVDKIAAGGQTITLATDRKAEVVDWEALYEYIIDNREPFLLQKRLIGKSAVEFENIRGEPLPGVHMNDVAVLRFRKS